MTYCRVIYRSHIAALDGRSRPLDFIFGAARRNNRTHGITGALTFCGDHFVQVLEGPPAAVRQLMDNLACDPRHRDMHVLGLWTTAHRLFGGWAMACLPVMDASDVTGNLIQRATCGLQLVSVLVNLASGTPLFL